MLPLQEAWASFVLGSDMAYGFKKCCADGARSNYRFWKHEAESGERGTDDYCALLGVEEGAWQDEAGRERRRSMEEGGGIDDIGVEGRRM